MKQFIIIFITILLFGCSNTNNCAPKKQYEFRANFTSGSGWERGFSYVDCDSVQMVSQSEVFVWVDGHKSRIIADKILIQTN